MSKIIKIIIFIIIFFLVVCTYLIILSADKMESIEEKEIENKEQMEYLKNVENKRKKN